jgi:hypothetical protein
MLAFAKSLNVSDNVNGTLLFKTSTEAKKSAAAAFAKRFLYIAKSRAAEAGLDHEASADDHPRHKEYVALIERAWKEASTRR